MNFQLTEEQELIKQMVREFAETEVKPIAAEIDKNHRFPVETMAKLKDLSLMGVVIPEEYGGSGADAVSYMIVIEELSRACASTGIIVATHTSLCCFPILKFGTEEQKQKYLVPLASGEKLGAFCLTEPGAGTDAASQQTTAVLDGDYYILNGSKCFITNGGYADTYIVMAMTDKSKGTKGISAFIVDKDFPGFIVGQSEDKLGIKGSSTTEIIFKDCKVPKENLIGQEGQGFKIAMQSLDVGRVGVGAQALGIAQACLDESVKYSKERVQSRRTGYNTLFNCFHAQGVFLYYNMGITFIYIKFIDTKFFFNPHGLHRALTPFQLSFSILRTPTLCVRLNTFFSKGLLCFPSITYISLSTSTANWGYWLNNLWFSINSGNL